MRSERGAHGGRRAADETRGGLGAAMDAPDGTPGSGWDVRFDTPEREALNLPPGPLDFGPGPSAGQKPTSAEVRPSTPRGKLEGGDRARASGEASGSGSGSPDENVNKRSNPPSPRELVPASPEAARARDESGVSTPSSPLPHQIPAAFEQRRRDALAAKQRRLDGIIGRVSSRQESGHREEQRATSETTSFAKKVASTSSPPRIRSSPARSKKNDSDVDEDWDELLADATPPTRPTAYEPPVATPSWRAFEPTPEPHLEDDRVERDESSRREKETTTATTTMTFAFDGATHATHATHAPNAALRKGWLSDAAAAAERAAELAGGGPMPPPASPPRAEIFEKDASFAEENTVFSAEASASSPGAFTPRKPPPSPFPSTPQSRDDGRRASPAMDKVAAARRIMAAASPAKRLSSPGSAREPVTNLVFSPPPPPRSSSAASTPKPSRTLSPLAGAQRASAKNAAEALVESSPYEQIVRSGSGLAAPDARKRAAARRIIIAAAARKASAGFPVDAASPLRASAIRNDTVRPETPTPAPFESPISPILAHSDASPAEPAAGKPASKTQEHKKPLAARGLGSALEATADVRKTEPIPIDSVPRNDAETSTTRLAIESAAAIESTFSPGPEGVDVVEASAAPESVAVPPEGDGEPGEDALALREETAPFPFRAPETSHAAESETSPTSRASTKQIDVSGDVFAFDAPKPALPALLEEPAPASESPEASPSGDADRYDTDAGYGTALETQSGFSASLGDDTAHDSSKRARGRTDRATRVALERAEMLAMRLEENEFLREALETRVAEAERVAEEALASKQSSVSDQLDRLREEVDRNAYLRRLLKKAEQRRGEARAREREAGAKFEALQSSAHRDAAVFASRLDRYEEESRGMRRRVSAEKARSQALERALSRANVELAEEHRRRKTASQLLGMAVAAVVVLVLRVLAGGRNDATRFADAGGYRGGRQAYVADAAARAANAARATPPRAAGFGPAV